MKEDSFGIAYGGEERLRKAIEEEARQQHHDEPLPASDPLQKATIEKKIRQEIGEEMKQVFSPYSLWSSRGL